MEFPKGFLIGSATASHQVEGNNRFNDIWAQEHMKYGGYPEKSGLAADQYNRYKEDIDLMKKAGLNAYRFSLEWSRIEPEKGKFNEEAIAHYRDEIEYCLSQGIEPIVTLFHFTSPVWLIREGGWETDSTVQYFARYVRKVAESYKDLLHTVCTINEANMGVLIGIYIAEARKQAEKQGKADALQIGMNIDAMSADDAAKKQENMDVFGTEEPQVFVSPRSQHGIEVIMHANEEAVRILHEVIPGVKAGLSLSVRDVYASAGGEKNMEEDWQTEFLQFLPYLKEDDFLGIQNYTKTMFGPDGELPVSQGEETTQMGYAYWPQGIGNCLRKAAEVWKKDLLVTENGIATADDSRRCAFIKTALESVHSCVEDGIPVKGYCYWSFIDNYEWQSGYSMQFGLVGLDRRTQKRIPHPSLDLLGSYLNK
jgi:beta-glucosidase